MPVRVFGPGPVGSWEEEEDDMPPLLSPLWILALNPSLFVGLAVAQAIGGLLALGGIAELRARPPVRDDAVPRIVLSSD